LDDLKIAEQSRVLDVPCGSGIYSAHLARQLGSSGELVAVDVNEDYLKQTRTRIEDVQPEVPVQVEPGDAYCLAYPDRSFDVVWCAQSLISLDMDRSLRELYRLTRLSGFTAVLEEDEFHYILLPWPGELEVAFPQAIYYAALEKYGNGTKLSPVRRLRPALRRAGFAQVCLKALTIERVAPFDEPTTAFLQSHCDYLREFAYRHLSRRLQSLFDEYADPASVHSIFRMPDADLVCLLHVYLARPSKPVPRAWRRSASALGG
jgi:SAM-dependent methyltransferase